MFANGKNANKQTIFI